MGWWTLSQSVWTPIVMVVLLWHHGVVVVVVSVCLVDSVFSMLTSSPVVSSCVPVLSPLLSHLPCLFHAVAHVCVVGVCSGPHGTVVSCGGLVVGTGVVCMLCMWDGVWMVMTADVMMTSSSWGWGLWGVWSCVCVSVCVWWSWLSSGSLVGVGVGWVGHRHQPSVLCGVWGVWVWVWVCG